MHNFDFELHLGAHLREFYQPIQSLINFDVAENYGDCVDGIMTSFALGQPNTGSTTANVCSPAVTGQWARLQRQRAQRIQ